MNVALRLLMRGSSGPAPLVGTYLTSAGDETNLGTYSFTSLSLGTAVANRIIVVGVVGRANVPAQVSSVTVAGVTATLITRTPSQLQHAALYYAAVPTGTTGTVDVVFTTTMTRAGVSLWSVPGMVSASGSNNSVIPGTSVATSVTGVSGGFICAVGMFESATAMTWTNATERVDGAPFSGEQTAADATTVGSTSITLAPTSGSSGTITLAAAALSP